MQEETLEITNFFEPIISKAAQDYAHMAFNNLFLTFQSLENDNILVKRKKRGADEKDMYLGACLYTESETIGEFEFVYPIKNGIESARKDAKKWVKECINKIN